MGYKRLLNDEWVFTKQPLGTGKLPLTNVMWEQVDLPHDWLIYQVSNLYETGEGWYRRILPQDELDSSLCYSLVFEGVYMDSSLYVNGVLVGEWKYGYSTFNFDISKYLDQAQNQILLRVVYQSPNSRWYTGAGIYRNVWLIGYPQTHLVFDGIYITSKNQDASWEVVISTEVSSHTTDYPQEGYRIRQSILIDQDSFTQEEIMITRQDKPFTLVSNFRKIRQTMTIHNPSLWDIATPNLYRLKTELFYQDKVIDTTYNTFGFRSFSFTPNQGFFLNGFPLKLRGSCEHHDLGCLGAAINRAALKRRLLLLRQMGINAIRTSHNMPSVELMELADELGFLIVSEAFDMWEEAKNPYDYARFFLEWVEKDVRSWIRRDRNHPCLILWSIGNEIHDTHSGKHGFELTNYLSSLVKQHDPNKNALITIGSNFMPWENAQKCAELVDVVGYNYGEAYYGAHHIQHPDWCIYGSETSSVVQSRGIYHFPYSKSMLADDDEQCSSLGNSSTSWGAKNAEFCIITDRDKAYLAGQFLWSGFDYLGEPTPYHTKNSYFGQIDTAGFVKDSFYLYQAEWTDYKTAPMVYLFPYWDFSIGQLIDVRVCSNAPKVELFFNDHSLGQVLLDHTKGKKLTADYQLTYKPGTLKAVAYDESDTILATMVRSSFGDATALVLTPDKEHMLANGCDLIFVEISAKDKNGYSVENANNRVYVSVVGAGRLIGLDNGDSTDYDEYKGTSRRLFSGKLIAVIAAKLTEGIIHLSVSSVGMDTQELTLYAHATTQTIGVSAITQNTESPYTKEIAIRKIELTSFQGTILNKDLPTTQVKADLHPSNCTYQDVEWRITDSNGIDSNIASIQGAGQIIEVTAHGDGIAILRCSCKNGSPKIRLLSQLEFTCSGFGLLLLNPYQFITGGLYNFSNVELSNGNERGVATLRDQTSYVGFTNIDFGSYGSDELTLSIFSLDSDPLTIDIWEGMPYETNSKHIDQVIYQKPSIWNTYQEETYQLKRFIKGKTSICFVVHKKIHIKGFVFKEYKKVEQKLYAMDCDSVYGDNYTLSKTGITHIGNNVSIEFCDMDFATHSYDSITICGRSHIPCNSIQLRFTEDNLSKEVLLDFPYSQKECELLFPLPKITRSNKLTLLFLPGCDFDLHWIQFHREVSL